MEEDDIADEEMPLKATFGDPGEAMPAQVVAAQRGDDIGLLAARLCGSLAVPPDFTAAPPLADLIAEQISESVAMEFRTRVLQIMRFIPPSATELEPIHRSDRRRLTRQVRSVLEGVCRPFLYDFASACGSLAKLVEAMQAEPAKLETRTAPVTVVQCNIAAGYGVGDRVRMPDGRTGIVVVPRGADGKAGVMPAGNSGPDDGDQRIGQASSPDPEYGVPPGYDG